MHSTIYLSLICLTYKKKQLFFNDIRTHCLYFFRSWDEFHYLFPLWNVSKDHLFILLSYFLQVPFPSFRDHFCVIRFSRVWRSSSIWKRTSVWWCITIWCLASLWRDTSFWGITSDGNSVKWKVRTYIAKQTRSFSCSFCLLCSKRVLFCCSVFGSSSSGFGRYVQLFLQDKCQSAIILRYRRQHGQVVGALV